MHVGLVERGRRVRLREIEHAAIHRGVVGDGDVENAVSGGDAEAADRCGRGDRAGGIDAGSPPHRVHGVDELRQRFVDVGRFALDLGELADFQHVRRERSG